MKLIDKSAVIAEIERLITELVEEGEDTMFEQGRISAFEDIKVFINHTLEVKEISETTHAECKKIKKLCEIQRYDEKGKAYSVMLPDTRLFMNKINEIIDAIADINSRLLIVEQRKEE